MERKDQGLGFLLNYENVAWYDEGVVSILDRRVYPREVSKVYCKTHQEVAQAIADMVTQSAGPYTAAGMGMALAAYQVKNQTKAEQLAYLTKAAETIATARPTTANRMRIVTQGCLQACTKALENGEDPIQAAFHRTIDSLNRRYSRMEIVGEHLAKLFPNNGKILTQCFGETIVGMMLRAAQKQNKQLQIFCAETRPYLQGARLTASVAHQMGFETTVVSDNMIAYLMQHKGIDVFTSAADTIARDGHIANKVGTYQIAILCQRFGIPYFVTGIPDEDKHFGNQIIIEERNPEETLSAHGIKHSLEGVKAIYPSFDITPPKLIDGVVTDKGIFSPYDLESYFLSDTAVFY
ncbi:MAG: S-methyl-5-thioribose-1-phosphate isomerase [Eubacteriales bacterium]|nr:S-methyl-5-thioribose-1-phosphate isomerase [Eubacteriales bacterium]